MKVYQLAFLALALSPPIVSAQNSAIPSPQFKTPLNQPPVDTVELEQLLAARRPVLTFRPDDIVTVQIYGIENYALKQRVADDGTIIFPFIGSTRVAGLTTEQLQTAVAREMAARGMMMNAQVSVITEARPGEVVSVLGDVIKPGTFPATGNLTIADYISQAQGFIESVPGAQASSAASYTVTLIRPSLDAPVSVPLGPESIDAKWGRIPIFAGDQIRVDKVGLIYAVGALKVQGSYQLKNTNRTTVSQLIALAGGIGYDSHIVRRENGQTTVIRINPTRILKGLDPDLPLQTEDILFVPTNQLRAAIKGGGPAIIVSLAGALLYNR
jgi:polysaccharide export outer membrane protein